ncbi:hypothetical protein SCUP515_04896 [Seiridium cupressi]
MKALNLLNFGFGLSLTIFSLLGIQVTGVTAGSTKIHAIESATQYLAYMAEGIIESRDTSYAYTLAPLAIGTASGKRLTFVEFVKYVSAGSGTSSWVSTPPSISDTDIIEGGLDDLDNKISAAKIKFSGDNKAKVATKMVNIEKIMPSATSGGYAAVIKGLVNPIRTLNSMSGLTSTQSKIVSKFKTAAVTMLRAVAL